VLELTVRTADPEPPVMVEVLSVAVSPGDALTVKVTVPVNPLTGATVMVVLLCAVTSSWTILVGFAFIVKSVMLKGSQELVAPLLFESPL
jgi:hypothetical protein